LTANLGSFIIKTSRARDASRRTPHIPRCSATVFERAAALQHRRILLLLLERHLIERYTNPEMGRIWSEKTKLDTWLAVEVAACEAWAEIGVIPQEAIPGIRQASYDLARVEEVFRETRHDVTAFLKAVQETIGPEGRYIHFGLTSSDVIDTALSLQLVRAAGILEGDIVGLLEVLERRAIEFKDTLMIGRTHGVHAEPTTFGLKLAIWVDEMRRNLARLREARRVIAVGKLSGAVGTHANVPPEVEELACARLGLEPAPVSTQVIQRDRHAQFVTTLAIIAASLEKFALEIRHLQRTEVREVEEPFGAGQTGSSAMPHKRNPELTERICGLSRVIRGHALTALENVALWHERDISHSSTERVILPDSCILLDYMLQLFTNVMARLEVYPERMKQNLEMTKGLIFSQRVLLALIEKGMSRQQAYEIVQRNAMRVWKENAAFRDLLGADPEVTRLLPSGELAELFQYDYHLAHVEDSFRRLGLSERN